MVHGGQRDAASRYFAPTLLRPAPGDAVMAEEIFGPLLPLVPMRGLDAAIEEVNGRAKPLALYIFSKDPATRRAFAERTSSGALCIDVPAARLPFPGFPSAGSAAAAWGPTRGTLGADVFP